MIRFGILAISLLGVACGARASDSASGDANNAGGGNTSGDEVADQAGTAGEGEGGKAGNTDPLVDEAERDIDPAQLVEDEAELAGAGFTLASSLCPTQDWASFNIPLGPPRSLGTFYVRPSKDGGLEAVLSTVASGAQLVEVLPMRRSGHGFRLAKISTCAQTDYDIEDTYLTKRYEAKSMQLSFFRETPDAALQARVVASSVEGTVTSLASPDTTPPDFFEIELGGKVAGIDEIYDEPFAGHYAFSEPVSADSEVSIVDQQGAPIDVTYAMSAGFKVGFGFKDAFAGEAQLKLELYDQGANRTTRTQQLEGVSLAPLVGDFEGDVPSLNLKSWDPACRQVTVTTSTQSADLDVDVPALAGSRSLLLGGVDTSCKVGFRLARSAEATELRFEARAIGSVGPKSLTVCISSLAAGGDDHCITPELSWVADPAYADAADSVSEEQTISVALPRDAGDLLVSLEASALFWLDSLRFE
ncbi:MAG TPA: hypothetical protein VEQ58_22865 [Polyangiaceae bacterium]|nr:hypothetical protein [Polyangiaceae bacterium]